MNPNQPEEVTVVEAVETLTEQPSAEELKVAASALYEQAAKMRLSGVSEQTAIKILVEKGFPEESVRTAVRRAEFDVASRDKKQGNRNMLVGALWCIGGTVVTVVTYSAASGGGRYVVAWGAIIFGAIQFIRGCIQVMNSK